MQKAGNRLPTRAEIDEQFKWNLNELYPTEAAWEEAMEETGKLIEQVGSFQGKLGESPEMLLQALKTSDQLGERLERIVAYARLHRDTDTTDQKYQANEGRAMSLATQATAAQAYMVPEILAIDDASLDAFLAQNDELKVYAHALQEIRRRKAHFLSTDEEVLLANMSEVARAPQKAFTMLNNADMKFPNIRDEHGEETELTHGRYVRFLRSRNRDVRRSAFKALYGTYDKQKNTIAALYDASVKKDVFFARARKYNSALEHSLDVNNIPVKVYDNLTETVRKNLPLMHRYVSLRKRALAVDELRMYDVYAPIVPDVDFKITFEEAKKLVEAGLEPLGPEYLDQLRKGMNERWLDVYESVGKASGAYSYGIYSHHPFVLLNHQDDLNSAFTLAHEMGHAMHSFYSSATQPYVYARYTIFLAEVASTVNESLLVNYMLDTEQDPAKRMYLINHYLDEFRGTVFRQTMFAEFERWTHEAVERGETLTPAKLNEKYYQLNVDYHGPDMVVDDEIALEWARIPHFYRAFYVYQYATGFSAASAISQQILTEGQPAAERYLEFLRSGSSDYSINLLRRAGVDMTTPDPIQAGMDLFGKLLDEMEKLLS